MVAQRLGLLGGTFNPVHKGHLRMASFTRDRLNLDGVLLITARRPPHKRAANHAPAADRHRMVELATADVPYLGATDIELKRDGPSYTVLTLQAIRREKAERELFFIVGSDTIPELASWYRLPDILRLARIVTVTRPGYPDRYAPEMFEELSRDDVGRLNELVLPMPPEPVSSTRIRRLIAQGRDFRHLVPAAVAEYIRNRGLYRNSPSE